MTRRQLILPELESVFKEEGFIPNLSKHDRFSQICGLTETRKILYFDTESYSFCESEYLYFNVKEDLTYTSSFEYLSSIMYSYTEDRSFPESEYLSSRTDMSSILRLYSQTENFKDIKDFSDLVKTLNPEYYEEKYSNTEYINKTLNDAYEASKENFSILTGQVNMGQIGLSYEQSSSIEKKDHMRSKPDIDKIIHTFKKASHNEDLEF